MKNQTILSGNSDEESFPDEGSTVSGAEEFIAPSEPDPVVVNSDSIGSVGWCGS